MAATEEGRAFVFDQTHLLPDAAHKLRRALWEVRRSEEEARDTAKRARALARSGSWRSPGVTGPQADVRGTQFVGEESGAHFSGLALRELNHSQDPEMTIVGVIVREARDPIFVDSEVAKIFPDGRIYPPQIGLAAIATVVRYMETAAPERL